MDPLPSAALTPAGAATRGRRRTPDGAIAPRRVGAPVVLRTATRAAALTLTGALLVVGFGGLQERRAETVLTAALHAQDQRFAELERARVARAERSTRAESARLTGEAVRFAAVRRAQALDAARVAVRDAHAVVAASTAAPDVPAGSTTPLDEAAARLAALIDTTPDVAAVVARPTRVAAGTVRADTGAPGAASRRAVPDAASGDLAAGGADAGDAAARAATPAPATPAPTTAPAATGPLANTAAPASADPAVAADPPAEADDAGGATAVGDPTDTASAPAQGAHAVDREVLDADDLRTLDLAVSAEVLAAARQVADLSVQTRTAADAAVAAAQAEREAAEVRRREAEAAARAEAALADRVAATDAAPNGQIPVELLCAPAVAPDALLRCDAAAALDRLAEAYRADVGRDLDVVSSYRSFDAQVAVKAARGFLAAAPGRSNHGRAVAVDLGGFGAVGELTAPPYLWMKEHAEAFGWHHPRAMEPGGSAPQEPWHWEFGTAD